MLTIDPEKRYTINDIKNHPWLMLSNSNLTSQTQSIPNCQLTNAILDHAESLGYNRTQILKSVNGNSYDSDAAIWHLLLEKFQQTCQINSKQKEFRLIFFIKNFFCFSDSHIPTNELVNPVNESVNPREPEIHIDYLEDDEDDDDDDEEMSESLREQYMQIHGLRRHTMGRPDLSVHSPVIPTLTPKIQFAHQSTSIEPSLLTNRLHHLQQQQYHALIPPDDENNEYYSQPQLSIYHQRNPHSTSYNGLSGHSNITAVSEAYNQQQRNDHWLSPPVFNHFRMLFLYRSAISLFFFLLELNRRASDSGAHLLLFQQQHDVTGSNTIDPARPTHIQSPVSNVKKTKELKIESELFF
jgi:hypothetical protein